MAGDVDVFLRVGIAGLAVLLLAISAVSFARVRTLKLGLLASAFACLAAKGALLVWEGLGQPVELSTTAWLGFDFGALVLLYLAVVR